MIILPPCGSISSIIYRERSRDFLTTHQIFLIFFMFLCLIQGFVFTSKGAVITPKVQTTVACVTISTLVFLIVLSVVNKSVVMAIISCVFYFLFPGAGQTFTLLIMGRPRQISPLSWILTILSLVVAYCTLFGRVLHF